jgi:hypothetical protein
LSIRGIENRIDLQDIVESGIIHKYCLFAICTSEFDLNLYGKPFYVKSLLVSAGDLLFFSRSPLFFDSSPAALQKVPAAGNCYTIRSAKESFYNSLPSIWKIKIKFSN